MKYIKRPITVDAFQFNRDADIPEWARRPDIIFHKEQSGDPNPYNGPFLAATIQTLEGEMRANLGDFIICGVQNELYPCKPDIFHQTYSPA